MSLLLINRIYGYTDEDFEGKLEMITTEDIEGIRPWRLKGHLKDKYPNDFSLITMRNGNKLQVAQSIIQLNERINGLKDIYSGEESKS